MSTKYTELFLRSLCSNFSGTSLNFSRMNVQDTNKESSTFIALRVISEASDEQRGAIVLRVDGKYVYVCAWPVPGNSALQAG